MWTVIREHRRLLATLGSAVVILGMTRSLRMSLLPLWADHLGLSASTTSLIFAGAAAIDVALMWPGGWLMDTRGRRVVAVPVVLSMAVACLLLPLATSAVTVALVMALIAAGNGLGAGIVMTLGADSAPVDGPLAVPRRLAAVRRHRQHRRPAAGQRRRRRRPARDRLPGGRGARPGRRRLGRPLDGPRGPRPRRRGDRRGQPTVTVISLEVTWVSVSITRNLLGPVRLVWT